MGEHKKFNYKSLDEVRQDIETLGIELPISENLSILGESIKRGRIEINNSMAVHPMEGCDGDLAGRPDELTLRRYDRFARGGAGLVWFEATAVVEEGRANPRQLYIKKENIDSFKNMLEDFHRAHREEFGEDSRPYTVLQLTHSGRYSRPIDKPAPIIAVNNPILGKNLAEDYPIISDDELKALEDKFLEAAIMAKEIGFDAVDIKACHGYLNSELLSAFEREGIYGGSFENRTRFLLNIVDKIRDRLGDSLEITLRMNAYDSIPYPYGWGVSKDSFLIADLKEPIELVSKLYERGIRLINITTGNPYYNPHVGRPYDAGYYLPPEHPLEGMSRMLGIIRDIQVSQPDMAVIATGLSWLREYSPYVAAGGLEKGWFSIAGFGRQSFAYPNFYRDILEKSSIDPRKSCIACGKCSEIMRDWGKSGCVIKDAKIYAPIYLEGRKGKPRIDGKNIAYHV